MDSYYKKLWRLVASGEFEQPTEEIKELAYEVDFEQIVLQAIYEKTVKELLGHLTAREQAVILMRYYDDMTLKAVGKELGITGDRVRQIEAKAFRKMKYWAKIKE